MTVLPAALAYFGIVFGTGFVLGPIRVVWLVPQLGERAAELLELPIMGGVVFAAARWLVRRWALLRGPAAGVGAAALLLLVIAELGFAYALRGLAPLDYVASRDPVSGPVYALMLLWFGAAPAVLARGR